MNRMRALKVVLIVVGLLFTAGIYPLVGSIRDTWQTNKESAEPMFISLYVALGIFLLLAARNPWANRSLIAYAGWANLAHAAVMAVMAIHITSERKGLLIAATVFSAIGVALLALAPAKQPGERASAVGA
ncbi:MAG TPA: DUF6632 domain-containing protein [Terriglobales bacterium]|nr:DUF6632 domain-containing protein [Terriglobales bacterium]